MNPITTQDGQVDQIIGSAYQIIKYVATNMEAIITLAESLDPLVNSMQTAFEALRRTYAESGFVLLKATFKTGAAIGNRNHVLIDDTTGIAYSWGGALPYFVPQNSTLESAGGIGELAWIAQDLSSLREELSRPNGVSMVGGAASSTSVDSVAVRVREALRRSYADMGYSLVDGSFEAGGTLVSANDVLLQKSTGRAFSGPAGVVVAGTNPMTGAFVDESGSLSHVYASDIATPNVTVDQGVALQAGYANATARGLEFIIDDVFWVSGTSFNAGTPNSDKCSIKVLSDSCIRFTGKGCLKVIPNNSQNYMVILACNDVDNYKIISPKIIGDRVEHDYTPQGTHEWGYGITIYESSNGTILHPDVSQMTGDGIYIGKAWGSLLTTVPTNIKILRPKVTKCRRNGISPTSYDTLLISEPDISWIGDSDGIVGAWPKACIDVEPESAPGSSSPRCVNGLITSPTLSDSYSGMYVYGFPNHDESTRRVIELTVAGVMKLRRISNTGLGAFVDSGVVGSVYIDTVAAVPNPYVHVNNGVLYNEDFKFTIGTLTRSNNDGSFMVITNHTSAVASDVGSMRINNVVNPSGVYTALATTPDAASKPAKSIKGLVINSTDPSQIGVSVYRGSNPLPFDDPSCFIQCQGFTFAYAEPTSSLTKTMPNIIWHMGHAASIYLDTKDDYRLLQIGLHPIGNATFGCNISGVRIRYKGVVYTVAQCREEGAYIRFRNSPSGDSFIYDKVGEWVFADPVS